MASSGPHHYSRANPEERASIFSLLTFHWVSDLIRKGNEKALEPEDLWEVSQGDKANVVFSRLQRVWEEEKRRSHGAASLPRAIWKAFSGRFILAGFLKLFHDLLQFMSPVLLRQIIMSMESAPSTNGLLGFPGHVSQVSTSWGARNILDGPSAWPHALSISPEWHGVFFALALLACNLLQSLFVHAYFHLLYRVAIHVRASLVSLLYHKALAMSAAGQQSTSVGQIVNLQSNDAGKIANLCIYVHIIWSGPLQIIGSLGLLFLIITIIPALSGLAIMLLLMPFNAMLMTRLSAIRKRLLTCTDARAKAVTELIQGIKTVKLYAWEGPFRARVQEKREAEMREITTTIILESLSVFVYVLSPTLVSVASLAAFSFLSPTPLTAAIAFPALALFNMLRFPLALVPDQINDIVQARVSARRLEAFLNLPEIEPVSCSEDLPLGMIQINDGSFAWATPEQEEKSADSSIKKVEEKEATESSPLLSDPIPQVTPQENGAGTSSSSSTDAATDPAANPSSAILSNIALTVPPGQLVVVIGQVGSGKSSLLSAILGEMSVVSSSPTPVSLHGSLAYTAPSPWIVNASLRDNILMGRPFDPLRYQQTLDACALAKDLDVIPGGDLAEIGEKGINLSGGQKHRVSLARAVYSDADIFLLDDPLSAVDTHVGRHIFERCICGVLSSRTRVLVTHQLQYVDSADHVVVMEQGRVVDSGKPSDLIQRGLNLSRFGDVVSEEGAGEAAESESPANPTVAETSASSVQGTVKDLPAAEKSTSSSAPSAAETSKPPTAPAPASSSSSAPLLVKAETRAVGRVNNEVYLSYLRAWSRKKSKEEVEEDATEDRAWKIMASNTLGSRATKGKVSSTAVTISTQAEIAGNGTSPHGASTHEPARRPPAFRLRDYAMPLLVLFSFALAQSMKLGSDTWLAVWTEGAKAGRASTSYFLTVYAVSALLTSLLSWMRGLLLAFGTLTAARNLHNQLLDRTLRLPCAFFDTQPSGRLVNRFTNDTEQVDLSLPQTMLSFLSCLFQVVFAVGIVVVVTPTFLLPLTAILVVYRRIQLRYVAASRELKRLDSVARSPIFAHFSETLHGLSTIRAFRMQSRFSQTNANRMDASTAAYFASVAANRWLGLRLEALGALVVFGTAFFCVFARGRLALFDAGFMGLALTNALTITSYMNWMVRMNANVETQMNSVERLLEFESLPSEAPSVVESNRPPAEWPVAGEIVAESIVVRYRPELPPVLKGISFRVNAGERIGICGRTGCGKSTLMLSLYRIMELDSGRILIDGLDVSTIGLFDLRSRLSLVPQDPVIFSGTVRFNLDPFQESTSDAVIWEALQRAGMEATVQSLPGQLDAELSEGGSNLSTGQRQLLCMARALLRHSRILVLDEATSNVDNASDATIQATIRDAFSKCTVLTIAHRLHTIADSDRVMLLEAGELLEFDTPARLLQDEGSRFSGFVNNTVSGKEASGMKKAASYGKKLEALQK